MRRSILLCVRVLCGVFALSGGASALTYSTQTSTSFDPTSLTPDCNVSGDNQASSCGAGDSAFHTQFVDGFATALASVTGGQLHAHADVQAVLKNDLVNYGPPQRFFDESSAAIVSWGDRIVFTNPSQYAATPFGYVYMTLLVEGLRSGGGSGYATLDMPMVGTTLHGGCSAGVLPGSCTGGAYVSFAGGASFSILLVANATTVFDSNLEDPNRLIPAGTTLTSIADFGDTAFIQSIRFTDASGNPLALDYTSESGASYPPTAPEPAGEALAGLGAAALAIARARSR